MQLDHSQLRDLIARFSKGEVPVPGPQNIRYGGNTPCVSVEVGGEPIYIFDCGSGVNSRTSPTSTRPCRRWAS